MLNSTTPPVARKITTEQIYGLKDRIEQILPCEDARALQSTQQNYQKALLLLQKQIQSALDSTLDINFEQTLQANLSELVEGEIPTHEQILDHFPNLREHLSQFRSLPIILRERMEKELFFDLWLLKKPHQNGDFTILSLQENDIIAMMYEFDSYSLQSLITRKKRIKTLRKTREIQLQSSFVMMSPSLLTEIFESLEYVEHIVISNRAFLANNSSQYLNIIFSALSNATQLTIHADLFWNTMNYGIPDDRYISLYRHLTHIHTINLKHNQLNLSSNYKLTEFFHHFSQISHLNISKTNLSQFSPHVLEKLFELKKLTTLTIDDNSIGALPKECFEGLGKFFTPLKSLSIVERMYGDPTQVADLKQSLGKATKLQSLTLSLRLFEYDTPQEIAKFFSHFPTLKHLSITDMGSISAKDEHLACLSGALSHIISLNIYQESTKFTPSTWKVFLSEMTSLRCLSMDANYQGKHWFSHTNLREFFYAMRQIRYLNISGVDFSLIEIPYLKRCLEDLPELRQLKVNAQSKTYLTKHLPSLKKIIIS